MMKNIFTIFLSLSLALSPAFSLAQSTPKLSAKSLQSEVEKAIHSEFEKQIYGLKYFDDVVRDMNDIYERVAPAGYSKEIVLELNRRLVGAQKLISKILLDKKMSAEKKDEYLSQLVPAFGKAWYKIYYVRGEDTQNDPRVKLYMHVPAVKELADKIMQTTVGSDEWSNLQQEMISTLNLHQAEEIKAPDKSNLTVRFLRSISSAVKNYKNIPGNIVKGVKNAPRNGFRTAKDVFMEAIMDFKALFYFRTTAKMESVWMPMSRAYQDASARDGIRTIADLTVNTLPKIENDELFDTQRNFWMEQLLKVINLRSDRLKAQRTMVFFYYGLAVWGFAQPFYDLVGAIDGWSEYSAFNSGFGYGVFWFLIGSIKLSSYSDRIVTMAKDVLVFLRDNAPKNISMDPDNLTNLQKRTIFDRIKKIWSEDMCESALTLTNTAKDSDPVKGKEAK